MRLPVFYPTPEELREEVAQVQGLMVTMVTLPFKVFLKTLASRRKPKGAEISLSPSKQRRSSSLKSLNIERVSFTRRLKSSRPKMRRRRKSSRMNSRSFRSRAIVQTNRWKRSTPQASDYV